MFEALPNITKETIEDIRKEFSGLTVFDEGEVKGELIALVDSLNEKGNPALRDRIVEVWNEVFFDKRKPTWVDAWKLAILTLEIMEAINRNLRGR